MFSKLIKILQPQVRPFGLLTAGLVVVGLLTALGGVWQYQTEIVQANTSTKFTKAGAGSISAVQSPSSGSALRTPKFNPDPTARKPQNTTAQPNSATLVPGPSDASSSLASPGMVLVSLSVNGIHKGSVALLGTSNHCDVLTHALTNGLISNLVMPYNSQYKTYGVYVVDGIGEVGAVWWTYQVNGKSPPFGCSLQTVHDGDSVNWQYIKS